MKALNYNLSMKISLRCLAFISVCFYVLSLILCKKIHLSEKTEWRAKIESQTSIWAAWGITVGITIYQVRDCLDWW